MTMDFKPPEKGLPRNVHAGDRVTFEFYEAAEGIPQITIITPMAPEAKAAPKTGTKP